MAALITLALVASSNGGNAASEPLFYEEVTVVGPASYTTGGDIGLQAIYQAKGAAQAGRTILAVLPVDCKGYQVAWDSVNGKLKFYLGDNTNAAAAPGLQVPNATDLSGVTFNLLIASQ